MDTRTTLTKALRTATSWHRLLIILTVLVPALCLVNYAHAQSTPSKHGVIDIPSNDWPDEWVRITDNAGIHVLIRLSDKPCSDPEFAMEIDSPGILSALNNKMSSLINQSALSLRRICYIGSNVNLKPVPIYYLGKKIGRVEDISYPPTADMMGRFTVEEKLSYSGDPDIAAEQALLDLYWGAVTADLTETLFYSGNTDLMPAEAISTLLSIKPRSKSVAELGIVVAEKGKPMESGCNFPLQVKTNDIERLRHAANLGSATMACRLAAILEQGLSIDVDGVLKDKAVLSVSGFADDPLKAGNYLEASCLRAYAMRRNLLPGMQHTLALEEARVEIGLAKQFLSENPERTCSDFAALAPTIPLVDNDEILKELAKPKPVETPRTPIPPFKIPRNDEFSLATHYDVGFGAGYAGSLAECPLNISEEQHKTLVVFGIAGGVISGTGGTNFNDPMVIETMFKMSVGLVAGALQAGSLSCAEPEASRKALAILDLVAQAKAAGELRDNPFLSSCKAQSRFLNESACECVANAAVVIMPDIYTRVYNESLINEINQRNPFLLMNMGPTCSATGLTP